MEKVHEALKLHSLMVLEYRQSKTETSITGRWRVIGSPKHHEEFVDLKVRDKDVKELDY